MRKLTIILAMLISGMAFAQSPMVALIQNTYVEPVQPPTDPYDAILAQAAIDGVFVPSLTQQQVQRNFIDSLVANNIWDKIDVLYVPLNDGSKEFSYYNWKDPTVFKLTPVGSQTWTYNQGIKTDDVNSYFDTGYDVATNGEAYTLTESSIFIDILDRGTPDSGFRVPIGTRDTDLDSKQYLFFNGTSPQLGIYLNRDNSTVFTFPSFTGFFHGNRKVSGSTQEVFANGNSVATEAVTPTVLSANDVYINGMHNTTGLTSGVTTRWSIAGLGGDLSTEASKFYDLIEDYKTNAVVDSRIWTYTGNSLDLGQELPNSTYSSIQVLSGYLLAQSDRETIKYAIVSDNISEAVKVQDGLLVPSTSGGMTLSADGTKIVTTDIFSTIARSSTLSTPFDLTSWGSWNTNDLGAEQRASAVLVNNGLKHYMLSTTDSDLKEADFSTAWDVVGRTLSDTLDLSNEIPGAEAYAMAISDDGRYLAVASQFPREVYEYQLLTEGEVGTARYERKFDYTSLFTNIPSGLAYSGNNDLFIMSQDMKVYQLTTEPKTPEVRIQWDLAQHTHVQTSPLLNATGNVSMTGVHVPDGESQIFTVSDSGDWIRQYDLTTDGDLSTMPIAVTDYFQAGVLSGLGFSGQSLSHSPDGTKVYVSNLTTGYVMQFSIDPANEYATPIYDGSLNPSEGAGVLTMQFLSPHFFEVGFLSNSSVYLYHANTPYDVTGDVQFVRSNSVGTNPHSLEYFGNSLLMSHQSHIRQYDINGYKDNTGSSLYHEETYSDLFGGTNGYSLSLQEDTGIVYAAGHAGNRYIYKLALGVKNELYPVDDALSIYRETNSFPTTSGSPRWDDFSGTTLSVNSSDTDGTANSMQVETTGTNGVTGVQYRELTSDDGRKYDINWSFKRVSSGNNEQQVFNWGGVDASPTVLATDNWTSHSEQVTGDGTEFFIRFYNSVGGGDATGEITLIDNFNIKAWDWMPPNSAMTVKDADDNGISTGGGGLNDATVESQTREVKDGNYALEIRQIANNGSAHYSVSIDGMDIGATYNYSFWSKYEDNSGATLNAKTSIWEGVTSTPNHIFHDDAVWTLNSGTIEATATTVLMRFYVYAGADGTDVSADKLWLDGFKLEKQ